MLRAAFNSSFIEGQTQTYRLEDIDPAAFRLFVQWLYSQKIDLYIDEASAADALCKDDSRKAVPKISERSSKDFHPRLLQLLLEKSISIPIENSRQGKVPPANANANLREAWRKQDLHLAQLWTIGDRLLVPRLQNEVMRAWHELWTGDNKGRCCSTGWVAYAYQHTCEGSPLRNLAVDQLMYRVQAGVLAKLTEEELPFALLLDVVVAYKSALHRISSDDFEYDDHYNSSDDSEDSSSSTDEEPEIPWKAREPKAPLLMEEERYRYRFTRTWRKYLVREDGQ